jgi:hypothetical protein
VEAEILARIVRLDIAKIRYYIKDLRAVKDVFEEPVSAVESRIIKDSNSAPGLQHFLEWFGHICAIKDLPLDPEPEVLLRYVEWAQKARGCYIDFLRVAFSTKFQPLPRWIGTIFKLGRYSIASKALVQLASEIPALLNPMVVEPVIAPSRTPFTIPEDEVPLTCVLRRVVGPRTEEYLPRLARVWNTPDVETHFRKACSLNLAVHAEMQLVNFYDHNRHCKPRFRFIGVSKKSCYLCHMFLATHPESFCISSCHQKLYLPWIPPPATDPSIYRRYKFITNELSKLMEAAAKHDLENRLGGGRRPVPADSTAGVSLSGLTESARMGSQALLQSQADFLMGSDVTMEGSVAVERSITGEGETLSESSFHPIDVVNLTPPNMVIERVTMDREEAAIATGQIIENSNSISVLAMVFHVMRADDVNKQNIVSIRDIYDPSIDFPSWVKLLEILKDDDECGIFFQQGQQFLIVNDRIRMTNERQFLACLQYLLNSNVLNFEALVYNT